MNKHKHYECIVAWAAGKPIQFYDQVSDRGWVDIDNPAWNEESMYRVKPEPKPDIEVYGNLLCGDGGYIIKHAIKGNAVLTFDGETRVLKNIKMIY